MHADIQQQKEFYNEYWNNTGPISTYKAKRVVWIINTLLNVRKQFTGAKIRLLDLGCGDGRLAPLWHEMTGAETYGLDLSPEAMKRAAEKYPFVRYREGDALDTGYESNMFDIVICQEVLEHTWEQQKLVDECSRILQPGGYLVLTTPNKFYFDRRKGGNYSNQPVENLIDTKQLYRLLEKSFGIVSYETVIYARGDHGIYKLLTNRHLLALFRLLGIEPAWKNYLLRRGYGLHMAVVARKRSA